MIAQFKSAVNTVSPLEEEAWNAMEEYMSFRTLKKHEHLWKRGENCKHLVFLAKGIFRNYYQVNDKEITLRFFKENAMMLSYKSFITQQPSELAFEALEESEVIVIPRGAVYDLYDKFKSIDRLGRIMAERAFVEVQSLRNRINTLKPEEKYLLLLKEEPQIIERVPQHYISSYLGMTPEHLSRIRKKITGK